jgi:hypothetical protein
VPNGMTIDKYVECIMKRQDSKKGGGVNYFNTYVKNKNKYKQLRYINKYY